ncbi:hypothetical protein K437DRAFT_118944 [Tilletiaria anomala UBC 951]|uniref:Uncharacterized protein n=1 Tax=Tilletiaria anomala (strain ATCC 24038 / CBS 436.72 / UBC 951) TaxID=1037660 RepID=A0A066VW97_TILAU|nr:uncharacterized protein K437DRAFT_118944 [Tilletiaria anomala UBC 951]KDN45751.1 hypothetical protein K437DRAFT_118944 [Tilletiaria anomala UBC 951]
MMSERQRKENCRYYRGRGFEMGRCAWRIRRIPCRSSAHIGHTPEQSTTSPPPSIHYLHLSTPSCLPLPAGSSWTGGTAIHPPPPHTHSPLAIRAEPLAARGDNENKKCEAR